MKSLIISSLFLTSAVLGLPAHRIRRQDISSDVGNTPSEDTTPAEATELAVDPSVPTGAKKAGPSAGPSSTSSSGVPKTTGIGAGGDGPDGEEEGGDLGALTVAPTSVVTGAGTLPTNDVSEPAPDVGADALTPPTSPAPPVTPPTSGSGGSCSAGTYRCSPDNKGWEVCDVLGTWVSGGVCQAGTACQFLAANGSPYCVAGSLSAPSGGDVGAAVVPPPPATGGDAPVTPPVSVPDSGDNADLGAGDEPSVTTNLPADTTEVPTGVTSGSPKVTTEVDDPDAVGADANEPLDGEPLEDEPLDGEPLDSKPSSSSSAPSTVPTGTPPASGANEKGDEPAAGAEGGPADSDAGSDLKVEVDTDNLTPDTPKQ